MNINSHDEQNTNTILLTTLNAKYVHPSLGLRSIKANMGDLYEKTILKEFTINEPTNDIIESILTINPQIIGFSISIWNITETTEVIHILKSLRPDIIIIVGGPEVSFESESKAFTPFVTHIICGEADQFFGELCHKLLKNNETIEKIIRPPLPDLSQINLPYEEYSDDDIKNRLLYVEASRGCPFSCQFCLSSLDEKVRSVPLDSFLNALKRLWEKGGRRFKFIDRTFNLSYAQVEPILDFFLSKREEVQNNFFVHFEMVPERFTPALKEKLAQFPSGTLQLEIGIQTFNSEVAKRISRPMNEEKIEENLTYLIQHTHAHLHTDLIAGLPGETLQSFAMSFDKLYRLVKPHDIQVGILKRLSGTPILQYVQSYKMVFEPYPPYSLLQNNDLTFSDMHKIMRFARYWEMFGNSGQFESELEILLNKNGGSPFYNFLDFTEWAYSKSKSLFGLSLKRKAELIELYCQHTQINFV